MRRVWLLLLAFLLPLQAAWAVTHGYAHDASHDAHAVVEALSHDTASAGHPTDAEGQACCDMSHSCHGLLTLVSTPSRPVLAANAGAPNPSHPAFIPAVFVSRHERPQWPPALSGGTAAI